MDELEISGKRYISSRRAGRQYRYHSDYIGQLIRSGKVSGTKVGRAWYVEEASLAEYLGKETQASTAKEEVPIAPVDSQNTAVEQMPPSLNSTMEARDFPAVVTSKEFIPTETSNKITVSISEGGSWKETKPVNVLDAGAYHVPIQKKGLTYIDDNGSLLPEIQSSTKAAPPVLRIAKPIASLQPSVPHIQKQKTSFRFVPALVLLVIGIGILSAVAVGSSRILSQVVVEQGKPASVGFSLK